MDLVYEWLFLLCVLQPACHGLPLKSPSFVSPWYEITSIRSAGKTRLDIKHTLGEIPGYVQVQVKSTSEPNKDFIFPAMGHILRDDDQPEPYSGIVYLYNDVKVVVSAAVEHNNYRGRTIYTENSGYWEGPNEQSVFVAMVRVRAWRMSSFPPPDFHSSGDVIDAECDLHDGRVCFREKQHNLDEFPAFAVVRTKLTTSGVEFNNYMADAVGAGHIVYKTGIYKPNGYVTYGFNTKVFRIWTDSSKDASIFTNDGYAFGLETRSEKGELEVMAWSHESLHEDLVQHIELGAIPGTNFEMETNYRLQGHHHSDSLVGLVWTEAHDGSNAGFRFPGTGSMAYDTSRTGSPCGYGGLTYAYTNTTVRLWKPGSVTHGKLICIPDIFANGKYSQGSNNGSAVMKIWTVSHVGGSCNDGTDCLSDHTDCISHTCQCQQGYYETGSKCTKELTCSDPIPHIPELARRQRNNLINTDLTIQRPLDDRYIGESWYRTDDSSGQYIMPDINTVPTAGSCGTAYPTFVKGGHPSIEDLTEEGAQIQVTVLNKGDTTSHSIHVRKCGSNVQYRLWPIITEEFAFCLDGPSIQGHSGFTAPPQNVTVGVQHVRWDLVFYSSSAQTSLKDPSLVFLCESAGLGGLPNDLYFTTNWFINGKLFETYGPSETVTRLTEDSLLQRHISLGIEIQCGIQLSASITGYKTELIKSEVFFAGIRILDKTVIMRKGAEATVRFEPTVPFGCSYVNPEACTKTVYIKPGDVCQTSDLLEVRSAPGCGTQLKGWKNDETWRSSVYELTITTEDVNYNDNYFFRLQLVTDSYGHAIWNNYQLPGIDVHITYSDDAKYKMCYSKVDPHMKTFDGYYYEHQYAGEYILYRNFRYGIEVQMKTTLCNRGHAFCACAVAIRAGGDVFLINLCGNSKFIGYTSCTDNRILVVKKKNERRYQVYTPLGTYIDIIIRPHRGYPNLMNIHIYVAPKDYRATEGLCGYYDNNKTNDLRKRGLSGDFYPSQNINFSYAWRIQSNEPNYLRRYINPVPGWGYSQYCACHPTGDQTPASVCSASIYTRCPLREASDDVLCPTNDNASKKERVRRSKLDAESSSTTGREAPERVKRDISESEAEAICTTTILNHSTVKGFGHRLIGVDLQVAVQECIFDVMEQEDDSWADVYPDSLIEVIETFNDKDPEYVDEHVEETVRFKSMSCPRNCSNNGVCANNGTCTCKDGRFGSDCSIDSSRPLTIDDIHGDGLCDLSDQNTCHCFAIQTVDLLEEFVCNFTVRTGLVNGDTEHSQFITQGNYTDLFNGLCCVKEDNQHSTTERDVFAVHYEIAISNDGTTYGEVRAMVVYDSRCQDVNETRVVLLKNSTCYIGGDCVQENGTAAHDECLYCSPQDRQYNWTRHCEPEGSNETPWAAIYAGSASGFIVLVVVAVCICCACRKRK